MSRKKSSIRKFQKHKGKLLHQAFVKASEQWIKAVLGDRLKTITPGIVAIKGSSVGKLDVLPSVAKPREEIFPIRLGPGTLQFVGSDRKYHCLGCDITEISDEPTPTVASKTTVTESATFKAL